MNDPLIDLEHEIADAVKRYERRTPKVCVDIRIDRFDDGYFQIGAEVRDKPEVTRG